MIVRAQRACASQQAQVSALAAQLPKCRPLALAAVLLLCHPHWLAAAKELDTGEVRLLGGPHHPGLSLAGGVAGRELPGWERALLWDIISIVCGIAVLAEPRVWGGGQGMWAA